MGIYGVAMAAASDLWGYGVGRVLLMGLRRLTYGDLWGSHGLRSRCMQLRFTVTMCTAFVIVLHSRDAYATVRGGPLFTDKGTRRGPTKYPFKQ